MTAHIAEQIGHHSFFEGLPSRHIDLLVSDATEARFETREIIVREGDTAHEFHLIREGKVAIEIFTPDRGPITIQTLGAGELLGWSWLLQPFRWNFDAQATEPTDVITFNAERIRAACSSNPEFGFELMSRFVPLIVQRLQATRMQLLDVYHAPA